MKKNIHADNIEICFISQRRLSKYWSSTVCATHSTLWWGKNRLFFSSSSKLNFSNAKHRDRWWKILSSKAHTKKKLIISRSRHTIKPEKKIDKKRYGGTRVAISSLHYFRAIFTTIYRVNVWTSRVEKNNRSENWVKREVELREKSELVVEKQSNTQKEYY